MKHLLFIATSLVGCGSVFAADPTIRYRPPTQDRPAAVEVVGLDAAQLARWKAMPPDWPSFFSVRVGQSQTAMLGSYSVEQDVVRFEPRFPLVGGLTYRVKFQAVAAEIRLPKPPAVATTVVEQIYPTADRLPENQLKFYLHFSAPMSRGEAYNRVHLIRADGTEVDRPFLELDEELWTPDMKRFTLFLHPGRVKRELKPREELGPILEDGKKYTLVVDALWKDENGNPLKSAYRKEFTAGKSEDGQPDPKAWKLTAAANSVRLQFSRPLDHALLQRMLWVLDAAGRRIDGAIRVSQEETVWEFVPAKPLPAGDYRLAVNTALEDLAGNSVARPFEVDIFQPVQQIKTQTVEVKFAVK
ncbi:MAG: hypothetical protein ACJ8F7_17025 [Gemmataceae bacterium]